jgi:hypothetical protein
MMRDRYHGDLRRLAAAAGKDPDRVRALLAEFPGIGPTAADIFCREAQAVWPFLRPALDKRATRTAGSLGLPTAPESLAGLVDDKELARLAAALVRVSLDKELDKTLKEALVHGGRS